MGWRAPGMLVPAERRKNTAQGAALDGRIGVKEWDAGRKQPQPPKTRMNRRRFTKSITASILGAPALMASSRSSEVLDRDSTDVAHPIPFQLSVMLWTVYRDLPFDERLGKMAEAG